MSNCLTDIRTIHRFLNLTGGNWRNSIYIECKKCGYEPHEGCRDFLCVPDENGELILLPLCDCKILFSPKIDPSECLLWISHLKFQTLYGAWCRKHSYPGQCPFRKFNFTEPRKEISCTKLKTS